MQLFVVRRHFILDISDQGDPHFGHIVTPKNITDKVCLDRHLNLAVVSKQNGAAKW